MITIIGRRLIIPDCDRVLGVSGDSGTKLRVRLSEDTVKKYFPDGATVDKVGITIIMEYKEKDGGAFPSVAMTYSSEGVHEGYVTIDKNAKAGLLKARALLTYAYGDNNVAMQTEEDYFIVTDDINVSDILPEGETFKAWNGLLEDIKDASAGAVEAEKSAKGYAETASGVVEAIEDFNKAYGDFSKQAETAKEHYNNENNPHKVTADQVGTYSKETIDAKIDDVDLKAESTDARFSTHLIANNPHSITPEIIGAYDKGTVDSKIDGITPEKLGVYHKDEINHMFEEFEGGGGNITVDNVLDVNSNNAVANSAVANAIGDIDEALDRIIDIAESLAPTATLG